MIFSLRKWPTIEKFIVLLHTHHVIYASPYGQYLKYLVSTTLGITIMEVLISTKRSRSFGPKKHIGLDYSAKRFSASGYDELERPEYSTQWGHKKPLKSHSNLTILIFQPFIFIIFDCKISEQSIMFPCDSVPLL